MTRIKICGITNLADAQTSLRAGAAMLGFNFFPKSKRYIEPEKCREIIIELNRNAVPGRNRVPQYVGVFVNSPLDKVETILEQCALQLAQLHGDEPLSMLTQLGDRGFRALRVSNAAEAAASTAALPLRMEPPAYLIDAHVKGEYGGTGQTADWDLARKLARQAPILLAGGLSPGNVVAAVRQVQPWGVDVASGVESAPGIKDPAKIRAFVAAVREADQHEAAIQIEKAEKSDLAEILNLQKLAYQSEAALNNDFNIPPLMQTIAGIIQEFEQRTFLKAVKNRLIVGSVRGHIEGGVCHVGRVIVHPQEQNQGIGSQLIRAIEAEFSEADCFEIFTSTVSTRNLYLYRKFGYRDAHQKKLNDKVTLIYLQKPTTKTQRFEAAQRKS